MRWIAGLGLCALAAVLVVPVSAQERLGDVAGSIKLNRSGGDDVVISTQPSTMSRSSLDSQSEGSLLKQVVEDGLAQSREFMALLEEVRTPGVFTDLDWRSRVSEVSLRLDMVQQDLMGTRLSGSYEEAGALAERGMGLAMESSTTVQDGIALNKLGIKEPVEQMEECERLLESASRSIGTVLREEAWESAPAPMDPVSAAATIKNFCGGKFTEGSQQFGKCVTEQEAAYRSGLTRSPFSVGLEEAEFNTIRNHCRYEWPKDLLAQNRCESERMARKARR